MTAPVLAVNNWKSNAELIVDVARLGYLRKDWLTLDATFGNGVWWKLWQPHDHRFVTYNRNVDGSDFRALPEADDTFDVCAYDPPFVSIGGKETSTIKGMHGQYGMADPEFKNPAELQTLIDAGLREMHRVVRRRRRGRLGGLVLVKCQNYVTSGKLQLGAHRTLQTALSLGFTVQDWFVHVGHPGPQDKNRTRKCPACRAEGCSACEWSGRVPSVQQHARQNASVLYVLRRGFEEAAPPIVL